MADITSIPAARVPLLEPGTAIMSREWYRFLFNQFGQTGGGTTDPDPDPAPSDPPTSPPSTPSTTPTTPATTTTTSTTSTAA